MYSLVTRSIYRLTGNTTSRYSRSVSVNHLFDHESSTGSSGELCSIDRSKLVVGGGRGGLVDEGGGGVESERRTRMGIEGHKPVARHPDSIFSVFIALTRALDSNSIHSERGIRCEESREIACVSTE